jgi:SsrA-binding protein
MALASYNPIRDRKLLLHRKEVLILANKTDSKGLTIIPLSVYTSRRLIKVKLALVKGKKKFDKRADIKKREINRDFQQRLKNY